MIARVETQQSQLNVSATNSFRVAEEPKQKSFQKTINTELMATNKNQQEQGMTKSVPTMDELAAAVKEIAQDLDLMQTKIAVRFDEESKTGVMEVIDRKTGEVIKQVPPEEILKIKKAFHSLVTGFLLDERA